jgi:hypothetical protein
MDIIKNWFYILSDIKDKNLNIWNNLNVVFFDDSNISRKILIWNNSRLEVYSFLTNINWVDFDIKINWENSYFKAWFLFFSKEKETKSKILTEICSSNSKADVKILSIAWEWWSLDIDWIMQINKWLFWVEWYLNQENLFIWNKAKIRWLPTLFVRSDDVKASHSCKVEKISDEKLFYLRSRWIEKDKALSMMLESYIKSLYKCLKMIDKDFYDEKTNFINNLINN